MHIKRVIIDNIHYNNFITFDISALFFFSGFALLKTCASYIPSNTVIKKVVVVVVVIYLFIYLFISIFLNS